ncbi:MAG: hypothetical protein ABJK39_07140 [Hyphomicrobiales bacterium]
MQEFLSYNINGIPLVFWGFMLALVLAMHFMARASQKSEIERLDGAGKDGLIPQPASDVVNR